MGGGSGATGGGSGAMGGGSGAMGGGSGALGGGSGALGGGSGLPSATATQVAVGHIHSCALTSGGAVRCWGSEDFGELGDGTSSSQQPAPVQVSGLTSGVTALAAFAHTTCVVVSGAVKCWGENTDGQLGADPTATTQSNVPVQVPGLTSAVTAVGVGEAHACAIKNGGVWCWGKNDYGQLGDNGMEANSPTPVQVMGLTTGATAVACGRWHSCAIVGGALKCWGSNLYGEMGIGMSGTGAHAPVAPTGMGSNVTAVGLGGNTTCAVQGGAVRCWGNNDQGECGNGMSGTGMECDSPTQVSGLSAAGTQAAPGWTASCAVIATGVKCWGANQDFNLGNGQGPSFTSNVPVAASVLTTGVSQLAVGGATDHVCAVTTAGHVYCWGSASPYLGDGDGTTDRAVPTPVLTLP
jgi:alpha-tubulin suppressor-like RCC1 family protein